MSPVRVGFIGCGNHATHNIYPSLRFAECTLAAVCDLDERKRSYNQRVFGAQNAYADYRQMFANESLDAVFIVGSPQMHHQLAIEAMRAGYHVFIEKPPAHTLAETEELAAVSAQTGRILMVAFMKRFAPRYTQALQIATRPQFGVKTHLLIEYHHGMGGSLHDLCIFMGIHPIDLARHFMGDVRSMHMQTATVGGALSLSLNLQFASGASGTILMNNTAPGVFERLVLTGSGEMIVVENVASLRHYPRNENIWAPPSAIVYEPNMPLQTLENYSLELQGYVGEVKAFIEAVKTGQPPQFASIADGVAAMRIAHFIEQNPAGGLISL